MENKPDTETQEQNTQTGIDPVTATQPPGESPDVVARQRPEPLEYIRVEDIHGWPVYFQNGHEDEFQSERDEARRAAILADAPELDKWRKDNAFEASIIGDDDLVNFAELAKLAKPQDATESAPDDTLTAHDTIFTHSAELPKGIASGSVSSVGKAMEGAGQVMPRFDPARIAAWVDRIARAKSLTEHELNILRRDIGLQGAIQPSFAHGILTAVLDGDETEETARAILNTSLLNSLSDGLQNAGEGLQNFSDNYFAPAPGAENSWWRASGEFIGENAVSALVGTATGGAGTVIYEVSLAAGEAASGARKAGKDERTQTEAARSGAFAALPAIIPIERTPLPRALKTWLEKPLFKIGGKIALEGGKSASQQFIQNLVAQNFYAPERSLFDGVPGSFVTGAIMGAAQTSYSVFTKRNNAKSAITTQYTIDKISTLSGKSNTQKQDPKVFKKYVADITAGTPIESMYLNSDTFFHQLEKNGVDPYKFASEAGITKSELDRAVSNGSDLKISTASYATHWAGTPTDLLIKNHMRFDPGAMSSAGAEKYIKGLDEALSDTRILAKTADDTAKANAQRNYDSIQTLLRRSEQFPSGANRKKNVGRAGDSVVQTVKDATGVDISNTQHSLGTTTIRDTLNTKHTDPQRQVARADIEAVHEIISSADRIISGGKNARGEPIIGYIKHMSDGRTLYLEQTKTGPKTFTVNALTKYPAGTDFDTVSQTVLSDVRAKNGDGVKMTPVKKGDAQPLPVEDGKAQPLPQEKADGKRASASEGVIFGGVGAGGITTFSSAGVAGVVGQFTNYIRDMTDEGEPTAVAAMAQLNDWWGQNGKKVADAGAQAVDNNDIAATDGATILGTESIDSTTKTAAVDSGLQRQFSRDFQTYMLEGKVPSPELAGTFETARKWLTTAYVNSAAVNEKTSPEVAEVFNRMLVSDGQLEMARLDAGESGPVFSSADAMGLSEAAYADFTATRQQSEDEASAEMLQSVMQPVRREQDKAYAQEKATVRTQVEKQVNTEGHYRATELMSNRRWLGDGEMPDHLADIRFDEAMLVAHYGDGILGLLPRGSQTVYTDKGGLDPDDVASIFGYGSGDELLRLMVMAPSRNDRIDVETARVMRERHGDPLYDGTADLKAMDAIHNDRRGQWLEIELKAVGRLSSTAQNTTLKEAHASAISMMSTMSVADAMESKRFLAAERRAAEEAERLGVQLSAGSTVDPATPLTTQNGDAAVDADISTGTPAANNETAKKLYTAKKRQLLNHALYVESRKIAHEVEEMEGYVQSVDTPVRREQFALASFHDNGRIDYNSAMDDLVGRYELSATQANDQFGTWAGRQAGATGGLDAFIEQMKAASRENELAITDEVMSSTTRTPYQKLPLQSLRGVVDSIRNLQHIAMRAGKLVDAEQTRDFEQTVSGVLGAFTRTPTGAQQSIGNGTASAAADTGGTVGTKGYERPRPYLDPAMNANLVLRDLDGSKKAGSVQAAIKAPVDAAAERLLARKQKAASDLAALYDVYSPGERQDMGRRLHVPALGTSISKWDMIAIALNTGTAENRRQLTDETIAGALSEQQVVSVLKHLDARDADFVQSVWDYTASFKPDIAARETRVTGVTPQWVEATPVVIGGKKLAGGYYPLRNNTDDVSQALVAGKFAKAYTSGLHGGQQQGQTAVPLELDMSVLHSHVNELVHDLELSEVVANTDRLLRDERIQAAFIQTGQGADHVMLQGWLRDAATGDTSGTALLSGTARFAKNNVTAARLATELGSSMIQMSGLSEAMTSIGQQQFAVNLQTALRPGVMRRVAALSPFMSSRQGTFEHSSGGKTALGGLSSWVMQRLNYQMVEVPVWLAGYHQGLDTYRHNEAKAISHADRLVKKLQTSRDGNLSDNAMTSRQGREVETLLTALGALMTAKSGTGENSVQQGRMPVSNDAGEGIALAIDIAALFHTDAVLKAVAHSRSPAGDVVSALSIAETMPFFRDAESPKTGSPRRGKAQRSKDNNGTKRLAGMISASGVLNDIDAAGLMATLNTAGLSFGMPATQISQMVEARMPQTKSGETSLMQLLTTRSA